MELKDIKRIVEMMKANDLTEFAMKDNEVELAMKRGGSEAPGCLCSGPGRSACSGSGSGSSSGWPPRSGCRSGVRR